MKQSKKLLSLVLAIIMMFGTVSVVANAGLVKGEVKYDAIDGAALTAEQVADLALDYVDSDIMYSINKGKALDLSILGEVRTDTIDHMLDDVYDLYNSVWWAIGKGLLGDAGDLDLSMLKKVQRSGGDLNVIYALLKLIGCDNNAGILSKAAYGIGTSNGLDLGLIESFMSDDLDEINGYLGDNLATILAETVFDELIYGSYGYPDKSKNLTDGIPTEANTVDKGLSLAVNNLLSKPQDYKWEGEGDDKTKVWNENSIVSRKFAADSSLSINLNTESVLGIVDKLFDTAVAEFGPTYLNNDVKKLLMEAVGVDFIRLDDDKDANLIKTITTGTDYVDVAGSCVRENAKVTVTAELASVQNYLCDAQLWKVDGVWYFRDYQKVTQKDANGDAVLDENGNEVRVKQDRFFKADISGANEFYDVINWDYEVKADFITKATTIDIYGSLFGSLNTILYQVLNTAINKDVISQTELDALWVDGDNSNLNGNIERVAKYILVNYTRRVFGKSSEYVDPETGKATTDFANKVNEKSLIGLVEYIGLPMFGDAMPQLILPEDGLASVPENQKLYAFGAAILREFMTQIAADRNYDEFIYGTTLTAKTGREFVSHTNEEWFNLLLNMGMDIAFEYTNKALVNFVASDWPAEGIEESRWKGMLDQLIDWAIDYIGSNDSSVLAGFEGSAFTNLDTLDKLSYAFNTLLPLGFISGCSSETYAVDFKVLLNDVIKPLVENLDIAGLLSLFGRDNSSSKTGKNAHYNILTDKNAVSMILDLANDILALVFGADLLPDTTNCATVLAPANLKTTVYNLLTKLYGRETALLPNALPVVAQFISEWGGEQEIDTPKLSLKEVVSLSSGAVTGATFTFSNGSTGVWRSYKDAAGNSYQDNQYKYECTGVKVKDINDNTVSEVTVTGYPTNVLDFGESGTVTYNVSGVTSPGKVVRFDVNYKVYAENGTALADGAIFTVSKYVYLNYNPTTTGQVCDTGKKGTQDCRAKIYYDFFIGYDSNTATFERTITGVTVGYVSKDSGIGSKTCKIQAKDNATQQGITYPSFGVKTSSSVSENGYFQVADINTASAYAKTEGNSITWSVDGYANSASSVTKNQSVKVTFYDAEGYSNVKDVVASEVKKLRKSSDYETGTVYATKVLTTENSEKNGKTVIRESNFENTAVVDGEKVTVLNGTTAWNNYVTAFNNAVQRAYQLWNNESVYGLQDAYEALKVAAADLDLCKIDETKVTASAGNEKDNWAMALDKAMNAAEDSLGGKSFYDYKMYRWSRYEDARKDARNLVAAFTNQNYNTAETQYFTYRSDYKVSDINGMIKGNEYETYIKALYEDYTEDEIEANKTALAKAKNNYANISVLDYANAANYVTLTADRLLDRDAYTKTQHLKNEYDSAMNVIGDTNTAGYTTKSWTRYENALKAAKELLDNNSDLCDAIFDAKYELQVARNELRTEEADDTELRALIAQAQAALANASSYANTAKDIGEVLAALGMDEVTDTKTNEKVDLFPNGALNVVNKSYDVDETKKYDRAANALREALSKLTLTGFTVPGAVDTQIGSEKNDDNIVTTITAKTLTIAQRLSADTVADAHIVNGNKGIVSLNGTYALSGDEQAYYTGTGSTLTYVNNVNVPLYTVSLIVKGDVNGDGVVDVLDAATVERVVNNHGELKGLYFAAAKNDNNLEALTAQDYSVVVNTALAG